MKNFQQHYRLIPGPLAWLMIFSSSALDHSAMEAPLIKKTYGTRDKARAMGSLLRTQSYTKKVLLNELGLKLDFQFPKTLFKILFYAKTQKSLKRNMPAMLLKMTASKCRWDFSSLFVRLWTVVVIKAGKLSTKVFYNGKICTFAKMSLNWVFVRN